VLLWGSSLASLAGVPICQVGDLASSQSLLHHLKRYSDKRKTDDEVLLVLRARYYMCW
jgi:hypothetical protein